MKETLNKNVKKRKKKTTYYRKKERKKTIYYSKKERKKTTYYFKPLGVSVAVQQALRSPLCQDCYKQESAATTTTLFPFLPKHLHRGRIISWLISAINLKTEEEAVHIFKVAPVEEVVQKQNKIIIFWGPTYTYIGPWCFSWTYIYLHRSMVFFMDLHIPTQVHGVFMDLHILRQVHGVFHGPTYTYSGP